MSRLEQIQEAIKLCEEAGRKPIAIVIHPKVFDEINKELPARNFLPTNAKELYGLTIFLSAKAKDFFLVDSRSWAEQRF
jgi:hypothetical protein